eukprot:9702627-Heterocapsa_arctica.AAC.1
MDMFRCRFYVCSAPASRWGLRSGFDVASVRTRKFATAFWDDLEQCTTPKSRVHHGQRSGADFK